MLLWTSSPSSASVPLGLTRFVRGPWSVFCIGEFPLEKKKSKNRLKSWKGPKKEKSPLDFVSTQKELVVMLVTFETGETLEGKKNSC